MANEKVTYDDKSKMVTVTFAYDPAKQYAASKTGKTNVVSTSRGFISIPGTLAKVSWNATAPTE